MNKKLIDLDEVSPCVLCNIEYKFLDDIILTHFKRLAPKLTKEALYCTLHTFILKNKDRLSIQQIEVPDITKSDLENHYEYHQITQERTIISQIRETQVLQERVKNQLDKRLDEKQIAIYLKLSNHRINLIKKLESFQPQHIKFEPYKYE